MLPRYLLAPLAAFALLAAPRLALAQTTPGGAVGIGTTAPDASAALDIVSSGKGVLLPRLTSAQRQAIASPAQGLLVFQTDGTLGLYYYSGLAWVNLTDGRIPDSNGITLSTKVAAVSTLAGSGSQGSANGTGLAASFYTPFGVAVAANGTVYVADRDNNLIRQITPAGVVSTLAGSGNYSNDNAVGTSASFSSPGGVAVTADGTIYVADNGNRLVRVLK